MPKKKKNDPKAAEQARYEQHIEDLRNTKYEISALTLAQISELLNHLGSIPYFEVAGMIGSEIKPQLPQEAQEAIERDEKAAMDAAIIAEEAKKEEFIKPENTITGTDDNIQALDDADAEAEEIKEDK